MSEHAPKLVMGYVVSFSPGEEGVVASDDAVIHLDGDEDSEIEVHCPNARVLAERIVATVNSHDTLVKALEFIIEMNRQHAKDQYGDAEKAESWACVRVARDALMPTPVGTVPTERT